MQRSLKERYETQRLHRLQERVKTIDHNMLLEQRTVRLILEAMNEEDLNKVTAIIQKLRSIKTPELPRLTQAIEQAEAEINKYTAGGPLVKAWAKMKNLVGVDNPIVKVTTFADALEKGFSQIPTILKNNGIDLKDVDLNKSLATVLASGGKKPKVGEKSDVEMAKSPVTGKNVPEKDNNYSVPGPAESVQNEAEGKPNIEGKLKSVVVQLQKALSPGGIFGVFKKVPYISSAELAQELVQAPLNVFSQVAKKIQTGARAAEVAPDIKSQVTGHGGAETKGTVKDAPTRQSGQTQPGAPAKDATVSSRTTPTGEETPKPQGGGAAQNYSKAKAKVITLLSTLKKNPKNIDAVVKSLVDAGLDPDRLGT